MSTPAERPLSFQCRGEELLAILHPVAMPRARPGVLIVVGGPQYRVGSHRQFTQLARALAAGGHAVLRFDCRGMGDSSGTFPGFENIGPDIRAAMDTFARELPGISSVVIFGLCDAASAALLYCASDARVAGLILANPWVRSVAGEAKSYVKHYYGRRLLQGSFWGKLLTGRLQVAASLADLLRKLAHARQGREVHQGATSVSFIDRMLRGLASFQGRVLFLLSERDLTAQEFRDLCRASGDWSALIRRPGVAVRACAGADHTFSSAAARDAATAAALDWLQGDGVTAQSSTENASAIAGGGRLS